MGKIHLDHEPRIWSEKDFDGSNKRHWNEIQENDRLVAAYCGKYGIEWLEYTYAQRRELFDDILAKAKAEEL